MAKKIRWEVVPRSVLPGNAIADIRVEDPETFIIRVQKGVSTATRTHELGHAFGTHNLDKPVSELTWRDVIGREIEAEAYSYRVRNKKLSWKVAIPAIFNAIDTYGCRSLNLLFTTSLRFLRHEGVPISKSDRSELWNFIKFYIKEW